MSDELLLSAEALVVPSVKGPTHVLDMRKIHKAEARIVELNGVTKLKAGELIHTFLEAFGEARRYLAMLRREQINTKQRMKSIKGMVILDKATDKLKALGLVSTRSPSGSADLREAVVDTDVDFIDAVDKHAQVEAAVEHMEGKVETLKMAYYAISDLIQGSDPSKRSTSGGTGEDDIGALTRAEQAEEFVAKHTAVNPENYEANGFGTPKY